MEGGTRSSERILMRIGETARLFFGVMFKEHNNVTRSLTTAVADHLKYTVYSLEITFSTILAREEETYKRRLRDKTPFHH